MLISNKLFFQFGGQNVARTYNTGHVCKVNKLQFVGRDSLNSEIENCRVLISVYFTAITMADPQYWLTEKIRKFAKIDPGE